jgi:hypothetical protein
VDDLPWAATGWRERAEAWIGGQLATHGLAPAGSVEEVKIRPWSAVLRAPTDRGDVYFKANLPALANEPELTRVLARIDPEHVLAVLADDPAERWMLQRGGGPEMRSRFGGGGELERWARMLRLYAGLQVQAAGHVPALLAAGAPDRRLPELRRLFDEVIAADRALPDSSETFSDAERAHLLGLAGRVEEMAAALAAYDLPASIDHSDLHAGNVLAPDHGYVFFDWHEAAVTHPFFSMVVATSWLRRNHGVAPGSPEERRLHDAYLAQWAVYGSHDELGTALALALRLGMLTRALGWMRVLADLPRAEQEPWAENVSGWLRDLQAELERP